MNIKPAVRVALFYLIFGYLWIYFSDQALGLFIKSSDEIRQAQNYKGWLFVTFSAIIIYFLLYRELQIQIKVLKEKSDTDFLFKTILERIDNSVIIFNLETWRVEFLNETVSELYGHSTKELQSNPLLFLSCLHPEDHDRMEQIWTKELTKNIIGLSYRIILPDGSVKWALESRIFIPGTDGNRGKAVALISDVTNFMEHKTQLEGKIRENKTLLTEVHHRVKNNLAVIISFLQLQANAVSKESADILEQSIVRIKAIALVHEKLYSSRNLSGLNSKEYITNLVDNIKLMYMRSDISIEMEIGDTEFDIVNAIPLGLMITEMLTNSFRHAFKAKEKDAKILIQFLVKAEGTMELIFSDNGIGFPNGLNPKKTNSIGLSVIFSLCGQLRGKEIEFFTSPGEGVRYHFSFPNNRNNG